ncbi:uncharacterized protein [Parasteatoda tepidariorum]|uniref:uncharacterized protein isoform X2 n=1 Tax=Parasteatoda tepidariorum TaxID=114398 RepID=UPI0039BC4B2D
MVLLLSSLLMGTSFLQEVSDSDPQEKPKSEPSTYLSNHPLLTGAVSVRGGSGCKNDQRRGNHNHGDNLGQYPEEDDSFGDGYPFGRPRRRSQPYPTNEGSYADDREECQVRFGLHYSSCFSKYKDFDDKFDELQHHVQSLPRGSGGSGSPCSTLQLLAKVKSSPIFDRCHGNQYLLRIPYQMYNVKGELRYIVQDPPNLEQCYLEASCSIPSDVCRNYGYPYGRRGNLNGVCESRHCHHTLLAWNPSSPDAGTFFDIFEYSCCCNCHYTTNTQTNRPQING